jgi:hypothetical protein
MRIKVGLIPNLDHETRIIGTKTWHIWNTNLTRFYYNEKTKTKQD